MAYIKIKDANFGAANGSLTTVGYQLYNFDGTVNGTRIAAGVVEVPATSGHYQANVTTPDPFNGSIVLDTGTATPSYAAQEIVDIRNDLGQLIPTSNTVQTVGDAFNAARADGFGKWTQVGTALTLYAGDGTTVVRTFALDSATVPQQRS